MILMKLVVYYLTTLITSIIYLKSYQTINDEEIKYNRKNIIIIGFTCIIILLNNNFNVSYYRMIISFLITLFYFKSIFKDDNWTNTAIQTTLFYAISCIIDLILSIITIFSINSLEIFNNNIYFKVCFSLVENLIIYYVISLKHIKKIFFKLKKCISKFVNFYSFSLFLMLILNILGCVRINDLKNNNYIIVIIFIILFIIITSKEIITNKYNNSVLNEKNNNLKNSFKAYAETIDECKILKHNLKNDLLSLSTIIPHQYKNEINLIINKYNKGFEWINRIDEIPEGLQGLIYLKINEAKLKKVNIELNISNNIKTDKKDYIDLTEVISILIDNALEATSKSKYKTIEINIQQKYDYLIIKMINNYNNNIDISKIGNKNYSTKKIKSGLGLNYIKNIKNNKIKVEFKIINELFITKIFYKQKIN